MTDYDAFLNQKVGVYYVLENGLLIHLAGTLERINYKTIRVETERTTRHIYKSRVKGIAREGR